MQFSLTKSDVYEGYHDVGKLGENYENSLREVRITRGFYKILFQQESGETKSTSYIAPPAEKSEKY